MPKLSGVGTRPFPKSFSHTRFAHTRAVSGLRSSATHSANSRRPLPFVILGSSPCETSRTNPRGTTSSGLSISPLSRNRAFSARVRSTAPIATRFASVGSPDSS